MAGLGDGHPAASDRSVEVLGDSASRPNSARRLGLRAAGSPCCWAGIATRSLLAPKRSDSRAGSAPGRETLSRALNALGTSLTAGCGAQEGLSMLREAIAIADGDRRGDEEAARAYNTRHSRVSENTSQ